MRILLAEDDTMIGEIVLDALRAEHYAVDWVKDGAMAETALATTDYDLLLLDLGLPRQDGLAVLRGLRARRQRLPVLIATARDAVAQRVAGLDAGADDYIVKPYDLDELLARIRALLRRADGRAEPAYEWGDVRIVPATREVTLRGVPVQLSAREWAVLGPCAQTPPSMIRSTSFSSRSRMVSASVRLSSSPGRVRVAPSRGWPSSSSRHCTMRCCGTRRPMVLREG